MSDTKLTHGFAAALDNAPPDKKPRPDQPQAPQGHCGAHDVLHAKQHGCLNWKARSQAPAPSLDARGDLSEHEIARLEVNQDPRWKLKPGEIERLLAEVKRRRASVTREQEINAAWIKGCLAGREDGAAEVEFSGDTLDTQHLAAAIRNLPAPTAPKEPQR